MHLGNSRLTQVERGTDFFHCQFFIIRMEKGSSLISDSLAPKPLHQAFTCVSPRHAALTNGRYQPCPFLPPLSLFASLIWRRLLNVRRYSEQMNRLIRRDKTSDAKPP